MARLPGKIRFRLIYDLGLFGRSESKSGPGSTIPNTMKVREGLVRLINAYNIKSICDIPCGDFYWMKEIAPQFESYLGADSVDKVVRRNQRSFPGFTFTRLDARLDEIPKVDLILCRDLFVHLSLDECILVLNNFNRSGSRYLLATTFPDIKSNSELRGLWRPVNLALEPFLLNSPVHSIPEDALDVPDSLASKCLTLFELNC